MIVVSGALLWGYVTATWVGVITNLNPEVRWFRETLDSLNVRAPRELDPCGLSPRCRHAMSCYSSHAWSPIRVCCGGAGLHVDAQPAA